MPCIFETPCILVLHPGSVETVHAAFLLPIFPSGSWLLWFLFDSCHSEEINYYYLFIYLKYVYNFKRKDNSFIQLKVDNKYVTDPILITDAFANHFASTFNANYQSFIPSDLIASDVLPTAPISVSEVSKAIKRLRPSRCVGLDGIPSFIIKGCSDVFIPLLTHIFNLSVNSASFPTLRKQTAVVPVFKKGDSTNVKYYRPISILNNVF
jgi:hypothetical protein